MSVDNRRSTRLPDLGARIHAAAAAPRPYDGFRDRCQSDSVVFDRAAERARTSGDLDRARACSEQAIRLRYLAVYDEDVAELFNAESHAVAP